MGQDKGRQKPQTIKLNKDEMRQPYSRICEIARRSGLGSGFNPSALEKSHAASPPLTSKLIQSQSLAHFLAIQLFNRVLANPYAGLVDIIRKFMGQGQCRTMEFSRSFADLA